MLQGRLERFLQGVGIYMERKGFMMAPLGFILPQVFLHKDRDGRVNNRRFILTWAREDHSLLFHVLWNNYHWEAERGEEVVILKLFCRKWSELQDMRGVSHFLSNRDQMDVELFLEFRNAAVRDNILM